MCGVTRPHVLLVPTLTKLEWEKIEPLIGEWADVTSYDAPGVGDEPAVEGSLFEARTASGLAKLDELGWEGCVIVGDEFGAVAAVLLAAARPEAVRGLALGHACLGLQREGERATMNHEVTDALERVLHTDYRSYVRAITQVTQQAYDDELADRYGELVPPELSRVAMAQLFEDERLRDFEPILSRLDVPLLLAEHRGCLMWTREGYEDAVAAFPDAATASLPVKPSVSPEFADALRAFCSTVAETEGARRT